MNREIGGYFELETYDEDMFHNDALHLNSGGAALRYLVRAYEINLIYVPFYTCPVVFEALNREGCEIKFYNIDENFLPTGNIPKNEFIIANNYFGICTENIEKLACLYKYLIVDNAQSFFSAPRGFADFYSPRKFFGLPDGGLLYSKKRISETLEISKSYDNMAHLLKRHDLGAREGYADFKINDGNTSMKPIARMSKLTQALMGNINYNKTKQKRLTNFNYLHAELSYLNELTIDGNISGPMVYPLLVKNTSLRDKLINASIYVARYWKYSELTAKKCERAMYLSRYLLPLPIDQRYTIEDMKRIVDIIKS